MSPVIQQAAVAKTLGWTMIGSYKGVVFLAAMQADLYQNKSKGENWNPSFLFPPVFLLSSPFPSLWVVEMDGWSVQESLTELQKCWHGAKQLTSVVTPRSVSPWCSLFLCLTRTHVHLGLHTDRCMFSLKEKKKKQSAQACINEHRKVHIGMPCLRFMCLHLQVYKRQQSMQEQIQEHMLTSSIILSLSSFLCQPRNTLISPTSLRCNQHQSLLSLVLNASKRKYTQVSWLCVCVSPLPALNSDIYPSTASLQPQGQTHLLLPLFLQMEGEKN